MPDPYIPTRYDRHRLECAEHPEGAERREAAEVADEELYVGHGDDGEVEPVPAVAQVRELVEDEAARQDLHRELEAVDKCTSIQGDHSGCVKPPIDIKRTNVPLQYEAHELKRNLCFDVNRMLGTT